MEILRQPVRLIVIRMLKGIHELKFICIEILSCILISNTCQAARLHMKGLTFKTRKGDSKINKTCGVGFHLFLLHVASSTTTFAY